MRKLGAIPPLVALVQAGVPTPRMPFMDRSRARASRRSQPMSHHMPSRAGRDAPVSRPAAAALRNLAASKENQDAIGAQPGAIEVRCATLRFVSLRCDGMRLLPAVAFPILVGGTAERCAISQPSLTAISHCAWQAITELLRSGPDSPVAVVAAAVIGNLALDHSENKTRLRIAGAVELLVDLLRDGFAAIAVR